MIDILLLEPETPGNIGAVARAMKNFGFGQLILINPKCDHLDEEAIKRAKHAQDILRNAKVKKRYTGYDYLIGTTSKLGSDYNIPRCPLSPSELAKRIPKRRVGVMFGREGKGLLNSEIAKCDFLVTIPTDKKYPAMNLSHAVAIILYELSSTEKIGTDIAPISKKEKDILVRLISSKLGRMKFSTKEKRDTQKTIWKKVIGKAMLTKREAFALMGFFRK